MAHRENAIRFRVSGELADRAGAEPSGEQRPVAWSHRWMVHGHWRQQFYRSTGEQVAVWERQL